MVQCCEILHCCEALGGGTLQRGVFAECNPPFLNRRLLCWLAEPLRIRLTGGVTHIANARTHSSLRRDTITVGNGIRFEQSGACDMFILEVFTSKPSFLPLINLLLILCWLADPLVMRLTGDVKYRANARTRFSLRFVSHIHRRERVAFRVLTPRPSRTRAVFIVEVLLQSDHFCQKD